MHTRTRTRARAPTFATRFAILIPFPVIRFSEISTVHVNLLDPIFSASEEAARLTKKLTVSTSRTFCWKETNLIYSARGSCAKVCWPRGYCLFLIDMINPFTKKETL